jgi:hypothetical protein
MKSKITYAALGVLVLILALLAGCTTSEVGTLVPCSRYHQITDKYQTPAGWFITVDGYSNPIDLGSDAPVSALIFGDRYVDRNDFFIGEYVWWSGGLGVTPVNLTRLSENESGMRDTCQVIP